MRAFRFSCAAVCLLPAALLGQQRDLTSMSLEDFMNVEVTSVTKSRQKLSRTPAAVFVITREDIQRSGASSLPEALRLAPGVHVARVSGTAWAIGIRGFTHIYSNKLLVMVDGRTVYNALLSGVLWDAQMLMLEDIDRIEVIRGPGAAMWGANAVSGVINIITRPAVETLGGIAAVSGGSFDRVRARTRFGARLGNAAWRAWGQYSLQGQTEFPSVSTSFDLWRTGRGGVRLDWQVRPQDSLLVESEVQSGTNRGPAFSGLQASSDLTLLRQVHTSGFGLGRWNHTTRRGDEAALQVYVNYDHVDAGNFAAAMYTADFDFQQSIQVTSRHRLVAGGGVRANRVETTGTPEFHFDPANQTYYVFNAFLHDEWELRPDKLTASLGGKIEHYTMSGVEFQPAARLMWTPTPRQDYWTSVSRAVRSPSHSDYAVRLPIQAPSASPPPLAFDITGSSQFRPEVLIAFEGGARWQLSRRFGLDATAFRHWYQHLANYQLAFANAAVSRSLGAGPLYVIPAIAANGLNGINQGAELAVRYDVRTGWRITGSYSSLFTGTSYAAGFNAQNSFSLPFYTPQHQWQLHSSWDFARNWTADAAFYRTGAFPQGVQQAFSRADFRIGRRWSEFVELSISGENLLRPRQREFVGASSYPSGLVPRSIEIDLRWKF